MQSLTVFYHLFIHPVEMKLGFLWPLWVDEQLGIIRDSGLADNAKVVVHMTLPINGFVESLNKPLTEVVREYITSRYPFAEIGEMRDLSWTNVYEGQTLFHLYRHCEEVEEGAVLYLHCKGITRGDMPHIHDWRRMLQHHLIGGWQECVEKLQDHDMVTVNSLSKGNIWWATNSYIRSLPNPLYAEIYMPDKPNFWMGNYEFRYAIETWPCLNNPKTYYIYDTGDHQFYCDFYPPSKYIS